MEINKIENMVKEIKCKLKGKYFEIGFEEEIFKVPKNFLNIYRKQIEGVEKFKIKEKRICKSWYESI